MEEHIDRMIKRGVKPQMTDLMQLNRLNNWNYTRSDIKDMLDRKPFIDIYKSPRKKQKVFASDPFPRIGTVQIDWAQFKKNLRVKNRQCTGFILGVDVHTHFLMIYPTVSRAQQHWLAAVDSFVERYPYFTRGVSDRETALDNKTFRREVLQKYNITWSYIHLRNKAYSSETYIRHVKTWLTLGMKWLNTNNWVDLVPVIADYYNSNPIKNTSFAPRDITPNNFETYIEEKYNDNTLVESYNTNQINYPDSFIGDLYKFDIGDLVRIRVDVIPKVTTFSKRSVEGSYSKDVYVVFKRAFTYVIKHSQYEPIYYLTDITTNQILPSLFYESDLIAANDVATSTK